MVCIFSVTWTWYWKVLIREFACVLYVYNTDSSSSLSPWRAFHASSLSPNFTRYYLLITPTGTWPQDALSCFTCFYLSHVQSSCSFLCLWTGATSSVPLPPENFFFWLSESMPLLSIHQSPTPSLVSIPHTRSSVNTNHSHHLRIFSLVLFACLVGCLWGFALLWFVYLVSLVCGLVYFFVFIGQKQAIVSLKCIQELGSKWPHWTGQCTQSMCYIQARVPWAVLQTDMKRGEKERDRASEKALRQSELPDSPSLSQHWPWLPDHSRWRRPQDGLSREIFFFPFFLFFFCHFDFSVLFCVCVHWIMVCSHLFFYEKCKDYIYNFYLNS